MGADPGLVIPKVIHQVWVGDPMPDHLQEYRASWARLHPDWDIKLWTEPELAAWLDLRSIFAHAGDYVPADAVGQFRADLARLEILDRVGGLYVDVDTEALRPIDDQLAGHDAWAAAEDDRWVGNTYLAAVPGHPAIVELRRGLIDSIRRNRGRRPNVICGPKYLTPIWRAHRCHIAPWRLFFPYSYRHVRTSTVPDEFPDDTVAVHHWQHTREVLHRR